MRELRQSWGDAALIIVLALLVFALVSCATLRVAGDKCSAGDAICDGSGKALSCEGGIAVSFACTGPKGCAVDGSRTVTCDQSSGATHNTPCFAAYEGKAHCSPDAAAYLVCSNGLWRAQPCETGSACMDTPAGVTCAVPGG